MRIHNKLLFSPINIFGFVLPQNAFFFPPIIMFSAANFLQLYKFTLSGDPAGARSKLGSGYGYGIGVRLDSPLGPLRLEYAYNDMQLKRFHFGVGSRN